MHTNLVGGLPLPPQLVAALDSGRWPPTADEARRQNICSLVPVERIRRLAPEETTIYLYPPPFHTRGIAYDLS